jgi:soluble lytic murein transglycosylase-like protein
MPLHGGPASSAVNNRDDRMEAYHLRTTAAAVGFSALVLLSPSGAEAGGRRTARAPEALEAVATTGSITATAPAATAAPDGGATPAAGEVLGSRRQDRAVSRDFGRAAAVRPLIARYASEHGVPYALADAVVRVESRYNAAARNGANVGLTQINARTAQAMGYQGPHAGLLDPDTNLRYGLKYLAQAYRLAGGDTCGTILRYQAGHRAQAMTAAARSYCARIQTIMAGNP